jgi:hypothetical protein
MIEPAARGCQARQESSSRCVRGHIPPGRIPPRALGTGWLLLGLMALRCMLAGSAWGAPDELLPLFNQAGSLKPQLIETVTRPTGLASYGGWAAWSRYDAAHRAYQLIVRDARGAVSAVAIAESPQPFEVSLGRLAHGGVGAVYARCANGVEHRGCRLEQLAIESPGAPEKPLFAPA